MKDAKFSLVNLLDRDPLVAVIAMEMGLCKVPTSRNVEIKKNPKGRGIMDNNSQKNKQKKTRAKILPDKTSGRDHKVSIKAQ